MHSSEPSLAVPSSSLIPLNGSVSQEPAPSKINPYNSKINVSHTRNRKFSQNL